ncbi:MAG TPA: hypothetical protein VFG87_20555 [Amycolatopsis sp.]|nr:hypothetical protein [Amycolatopsis sp.]
MSPPSRRRPNHLRVVPDTPARPPDPVALGRELLTTSDPWAVERTAATFLADAERAGRLPRSVLGEDLPALEKKATRAALAMLLAIGSIGGTELGTPATEAAGRLVAAGVRPPPWAAKLAQPVEPGDAWRLYYADGATIVLNCTFHRDSTMRSLVVMVDHLGGDVATDILDLDDDGLADALDRMAELGRRNEAQVTLETAGRAVIRDDMERALRTRTERDRSGIPLRSLGDEVLAEEVPDYPAMAWLLRARLPLMTEAPKARYDPTRPRLSLLPGGGENSGRTE